MPGWHPPFSLTYWCSSGREVGESWSLTAPRAGRFLTWSSSPLPNALPTRPPRTTPNGPWALAQTLVVQLQGEEGGLGAGCVWGTSIETRPRSWGEGGPCASETQQCGRLTGRPLSSVTPAEGMLVSVTLHWGVQFGSDFTLSRDLLHICNLIPHKGS